MNFFQKIIRIAIRDKVSKEIIWSLLAKLIALLLILAINIILARYLGTNSFGIYNIFLSVINIILVLVTFGIDISASRLIAKYNRERETVQYIVNAAIQYRVAILFAFLGIIYFSTGKISDFYQIEKLDILLRIAVIFIFFKSLISLIRVLYQGFHRLKYLAIISFLEHFLALFAIIVVILFLENSGLVEIVQGLSIGSLIAFIIILTIFVRYLKQKRQEQKVVSKRLFDRRKIKKELFLYAKPLYLISLMVIVAGELDVLMLAKYVDSSEVSFYSIPKQLVQYLPIFSLSVGLGIAPLYSRLNKNNHAKLKNIFYRSIKFTCILYFLLILPLIFFFEKIIFFFYGVDYLNAVKIFYYFIPYLFYVFFFGITSQVLDYMGLAKKRAIILASCVLLNFILNLLLIPAYRGVGAAISYSVSYLPYLLFSFHFIIKEFSKYKQ